METDPTYSIELPGFDFQFLMALQLCISEGKQQKRVHSLLFFFLLLCKRKRRTIIAKII